MQKGQNCILNNKEALVFRKAIFLFLSIFLFASCSKNANDVTSQKSKSEVISSSEKKLNPSDIATPEGMPPIGKWMYQDDMQRAHWLGVKWEGKNLIEPINIILIDKVSKTTDNAKRRLRENLKKSGYDDRSKHSSGYIGYIGGAFYPQIPEEKDHAFSNEVAEIDNNHGRIFGPYFNKKKYYFVAALSREVVAPVSKIKHHYGSFNRARDEFSQSLNKNSEYKIVRFVNLDNVILNDGESTTGDHDGVAVVLSTMQ